MCKRRQYFCFLSWIVHCRKSITFVGRSPGFTRLSLVKNSFEYEYWALLDSYWQGTPYYSEKHLSHCHFSPGTEPGSPLWSASEWPPGPWHSRLHHTYLCLDAHNGDGRRGKLWNNVCHEKDDIFILVWLAISGDIYWNCLNVMGRQAKNDGNVDRTVK